MDEYCKLQSGEIFQEFDCLLNFSGEKSDRFYRIQVLKNHKGFHVWTRWGRNGTGGQNKLDGPLSQANAEKNFKKKFLEKTKNSWDKRQQFVAVKGKYTLVQNSDSSQNSQAAESQKPGAFLSEVQQLPVELLRNILLQLPVRDVLRYMQVCKDWRTMLSEKCFWKMYVQKHFDLGIKSDLSNEGPMAQWSGPVWTANGKVEPQSDGTWECLFSEDEEDDDDIYLIRPFPSMWNCRVFHPYGLVPFSGDVRSLQGFSRSLEILTYMRSEASRLGMHSESTWDEVHEICAVIFPWDKQELPTTLELLNGVFHFHPEIYNHYADLSPEGYSTLNENMLIFHIPQDVGLIHDCAIRPCLNSIFGVSAPKTDEPWRLRDSRAFYEWLQPIMCPSFTAYVGDDVFSPMALCMLTQLAPGWVGGALTSGD